MDDAPRSLPQLLGARECGALSPPGLRVAIAARRRASLLLSPTVLPLPGPRGVRVPCVALEPTRERLLLCGCGDGSVALLDTTLAHAPSPVLRLRRAAGVASRAATVGVLHAPDGGRHAASVSAAAWHPDGGVFFTVASCGTACGWDASGACSGSDDAPLLSFGRLAPRLCSLAVPPDAVASPHGLLAVGCSDGRALLLDPACGSGTHALPVGTRRLSGGASSASSAVTALAWVPSCGWLLVAGSSDGRMGVWDVRSPAHSLPPPPRAFSSNTQFSSTHSRAPHSPGPAAAWEVDGGGGCAHAGGVSCVAITRDGSAAVSGGADGRLRGWACPAGEPTCVHYSLPGGAAAAGGVLRPLPIESLALSWDGASAFVPSGRGVAVMDVRSGALAAVLRGGGGGGGAAGDDAAATVGAAAAAAAAGALPSRISHSAPVTAVACGGLRGDEAVYSADAAGGVCAWAPPAPRPPRHNRRRAAAGREAARPPSLPHRAPPRAATPAELVTAAVRGGGDDGSGAINDWGEDGGDDQWEDVDPWMEPPEEAGRGPRMGTGGREWLRGGGGAAGAPRFWDDR